MGPAPASRGVGPSERRRHHAVAAIIAALSVTELGGGRNAGGPIAAAAVGDALAEARVRGDAARERRGSGRRASSAAATSFETSWSTAASWNDAATSATGSVGMLAHEGHDRGLQPGEGEVGLAGHRPRERDRVAVAAAREAVDRGTARVAEPEEARDLVERLAGRVVDGLAEHLVVAVARG